MTLICSWRSLMWRLGRLGDAGAEAAKMKKLYAAITLQEWRGGMLLKILN